MGTYAELTLNLAKQIGHLQKQNAALHKMDSNNIALLIKVRPLIAAYRRMVHDLSQKPANTYGQQYWCEQELVTLDECLEKLRIALGQEGPPCSSTPFSR